MADDLAEVLARLRRHVQRVRDDGYTVSSRIGLEDLTAILDAAEAGMKARNKALEEAAKVVDDHYWDTCSPEHGKFLAKTIRALKEKKP